MTAPFQPRDGAKRTRPRSQHLGVGPTVRRRLQGVHPSGERVPPHRRRVGERDPKWRNHMLLLLAFLIVLLFFGLGFALHLLWILAAIFLVLWLVGYALGRGESAGRHRFYRW